MTILRRLIPDDIEGILNLGVKQDEFQCTDQSDFWKKEELLLWISKPNHICLGLFLKDDIVGYCLSHIFKGINKVSIENIYVHPHFRNKGFAKILLDGIIREYNIDFPLEFNNLRFIALIHETNIPSLKLVERCNFTLGERMIWVQR